MREDRLGYIENEISKTPLYSLCRGRFEKFTLLFNFTRWYKQHSTREYYRRSRSRNKSKMER